jgi:hypothetical protein
MPRVGFEPTILVFARAKTVHALDRAGTVIGQSGGIAPPLLTSALGGGEFSASHPYRFTSEETAPGTHCIGGWVGPSADLDVMEKKKISWPYREWNTDSSVVRSLVTIPTDLSRLIQSF